MNKRDPRKLYPHDYLLKPVVWFIPLFVHPNHVTVFRMFLIPIVLWLLYEEHWIIGFVLFLFAAFTDALDGSIARIRKQITSWGTFYDPVADKLLIGSVVLLIVFQYVHPLIVVSLIGVELLIIIGGWYRTRTQDVEAANLWAKVKMVFQVVGVGLILLSLVTGVPIYIDFAEGVLVLAIVFAIASLLTYSL